MSRRLEGGQISAGWGWGVLEHSHKHRSRLVKGRFWGPALTSLTGGQGNLTSLSPACDLN